MAKESSRSTAAGIGNKSIAKRSLSTDKTVRATKKATALTAPDLMPAIQAMLAAEPDDAHLLAWLANFAQASTALAGLYVMSARQRAVNEAGGTLEALRKLNAETPLKLTEVMDAAQEDVNKAIALGKSEGIAWLDRYIFGNATNGKE